MGFRFYEVRSGDFLPQDWAGTVIKKTDTIYRSYGNGIDQFVLGCWKIPNGQSFRDQWTSGTPEQNAYELIFRIIQSKILRLV